jgi:predicted secreted hydrolase
MLPAGETWKSLETNATYLVEWQLSVQKLGLQLIAKTRLKSQELVGRSGIAPNYWEGAMEFTGTRGMAPVQGVGYLEMTGYDAAVVFGADRKR